MPLLAILAAALQDPAPALPRFERRTIDAELSVGYGVAVGDVDGDGAPDLLLVDRGVVAWYRNPTWERFLLAERLTERDHVCIAARDVDGDGRVEVAVGAGWNPGDTEGSGALFYLVPPEDRTQPWAPVRLPCEPTIHRARWVRAGKDRFDLVVAPLHGRGNTGGEGAGARLLAYRMPADPRAPWARTLIDDSLHVTHNLDPVQWDPATPAEELLYIGREGALLLAPGEGGWRRTELERVPGGGEIRGALVDGAPRLVATIEPLHGNLLVAYRAEDGALVDRTVLADDLAGGHALALADLTGDGAPEVVAGWRLPNAAGAVGLRYYRETGGAWEAHVIDGVMACEDVRAADLDGDGRVDLVAAGRASRDLAVYWNRAP